MATDKKEKDRKDREDTGIAKGLIASKEEDPVEEYSGQMGSPFQGAVEKEKQAAASESEYERQRVAGALDRDIKDLEFQATRPPEEWHPLISEKPTGWFGSISPDGVTAEEQHSKYEKLKAARAALNAQAPDAAVPATDQSVSAPAGPASEASATAATATATSTPGREKRASFHSPELVNQILNEQAWRSAVNANQGANPKSLHSDYVRTLQGLANVQSAFERRDEMQRAREAGAVRVGPTGELMAVPKDARAGDSIDDRGRVTHFEDRYPDVKVDESSAGTALNSKYGTVQTPGTPAVSADARGVNKYFADLEERKQTDAALRASGRSPYGLPSESEFSERVASIQQQLREQPGTRVAPQQWTPNYEPLAADSGQTLKEAEDAQQARYQARLQESDARDLLEKAMRPQPSGDPVRDVGIAQDRATAIAQLARSRGEDPEKVAEALMPGKTSADSDRKLNELTKQFLRGEPSDVALEQAVLNNSSPSKSSRDENADALTLMKNLGAKRARESEVETKKELADAKKLADERVNEDRDLKRQDLEEAKKEAATARKIDGLQRRIDSAEKRREKLLSDPVASKIEPAKSLISQIEKQMEDMQLQLDDLQDVSSDEVNETNSRADELLSKYAPKTNP